MRQGAFNKEMLCVGRESFSEAVNGGLRWFVLQHDCDVVWPGLIKLIEKSLNTDAREQQSEIEVMLAMHHASNSALQRGVDPNWDQICKDASCSLPPCAGWVGALADYVKSNSGGMKGELLQELNTFRRAFRCSAAGSKRMLGSDFFRKLASMNFGHERFPYVLNACVKANLQSPATKHIDGFCKLISPQALTNLVSKEKRPLVREAETMMTDARQLASALKINPTETVKIIGKLDCRLVLHILKLGKVGEGRDYASIAEISEVLHHTLLCMGTSLCMHSCIYTHGCLDVLQHSEHPFNDVACLSRVHTCASLMFILFARKVFLNDFAEEERSKVKELIATSGLDLPSFSVAKNSEEPSGAEAPATGKQPETIDQLHSKLFQIGKSGWQVGAFVQPKDADEVTTWLVKAMTDDGATLEEQRDGHAGQSKEVSIDDLLKSWRLYKGKVTQLLEGWSFDSNRCSPLSSAAWSYDIVKGCINIAVYEQYKKHEHHVENLEVLQHPSAVKTKVAFKACELRLVAASTRLDRKSGTKDSVCCGTFDIIKSDMFLLPHFSSPMKSDGEANKQPWVCPFWIVASCKEERESNMDLIYEKVSVNNIEVSVPILTNKKDLDAGVQLKWVKKASPSNPSSSSKKSDGAAAPKKR